MDTFFECGTKHSGKCSQSDEVEVDKGSISIRKGTFLSKGHQINVNKSAQCNRLNPNPTFLGLNVQCDLCSQDLCSQGFMFPSSHVPRVLSSRVLKSPVLFL